MEMETDLNVILQKKKDDGDHPSSAEAYNNSSASSNNIGFARLDCVRRVNRVVFVDEITAVDAESSGAGADDETGEYYW